MKVIKMVKTESWDYVIKSKYKDNPWKTISTLYTELRSLHEDRHSLHNVHGGFINASSILKWIEHKLFEYHKGDKTTTVTNHEYVGLDKVRSEIRAEEEAKVKYDLDMARDSIKKIESLNKEIKSLEDTVKSTLKDFENYVEDSNKRFENYGDSMSNYLDSFTSKVQLVSEDSNIFNRRRNIKKYLEGREKFLEELKNL